MKYFLLSWLIIMLNGCGGPAARQPAPDLPPPPEKILYFPQTGHSVQPPFVDYFERRNELALLGYPITEAIEHDGWRVQFFQNGRLELHPENEPAYRVTVGWVGQLLHKTQPPHRPQSAGTWFAKSGHTVQADFLTFFEANNGTVQFGLPLSEPFLCAGLICQDFQSARMIWNPALPPGRRVYLAPLGEDYFLESGLSLAHLSPIEPPPGAELYSGAARPMPAGAKVALNIEQTANPQVVRVSITVTQNGEPLKQQAPRLSRRAEKKEFPPTTGAGQTHILVILPQPADVTFIVLHPQTDKVLAAQRYVIVSP